MDASAKYRVRLWLRSERAMGLSSLPVKPAPPADTPAMARSTPRHPAPATPPRPAPVAAAHRQPDPTPAQPPARAPVELFVSRALLDGPEASREEKIRVLREMDEKQVKGCTRCRLHETRTHTVFGEGAPDAQLMFIGEGPGENEDLTGRPFVGRAGQKLDEMIGAMGLKREQVFIGNIVKCRPPGNRVPAPDEVETCTPYLLRQIEVIRPKVIVTLGLPASQYMLKSKTSMGRLRGQWHDWRGIKLMPTYHPAYILRNYTIETRKAVWSDLQKVMAELGLKPKS